MTQVPIDPVPRPDRSPSTPPPTTDPGAPPAAAPAPSVPPDSAPYYESDRAVAEYLLFHYGPAELLMPWAFGPSLPEPFPVRCVRELLDSSFLPPQPRGLDLGCAVGRSTFELARFCPEVIGIDLSRRFIDTALRLRSQGTIEFDLRVDGARTTSAVARLPRDLPTDRVRFQTGDALQLPEDLGTFDVILAANLIDRVPRPRDLIRQLARRLRPSGQLLLTSPYTWLEEYTPSSEWLSADGASSLDALHQLLNGWTCSRRIDLPFVIRETARKFQWSVAEGTAWRKPG